MPPKKIIYQNIIIRGREFDHEVFKIHKLDDDEVPRLIHGIERIGEFVRGNPSSKSIESVVNNSPLFHLEGLVRHQLNRVLYGTHFSINDFSSTSDFIQEETEIREINCMKTSFLFDFLREIVFLSDSPNYIDQYVLDKLECNLRGLFFLAEPQLTANLKYKNKGFVSFSYLIWKKWHFKKLLGKEFWDVAIKELNKYPYKLEFEVNRSPTLQIGDHKIKDRYIVCQEKNKQSIQIICKSKDIRDKPARNKDWVVKNWPKIHKLLLKEKERTDKMEK